MYVNSKAYVRVDGQISKAISCNKGVRQGCPLSPILFCLFISDMFEVVGEDVPGIGIGKHLLHGLLYADDAIMLGKNYEHMKALLCQLEIYCERKDLKVNTSKTKIMRINDKNGAGFHYGGIALEEVEEFKYLGFYINNKGNIMKGAEECAIAAERAYYALRGLHKKMRGLRTPDICYLFTALVEPVMLYASEIWGSVRIKRPESLLLRFCKTVLKVPPSCTSTAIYGELGRTPVFLTLQVRAVKYYNRLQSANCPPIVSEAFVTSKHLKRMKNTFHNRFINMIRSYERYDEMDVDLLKLDDFEEVAYEDFISKWNSELNRVTDAARQGRGNKLRFYKAIKREFRMEPYLYLNLSPKQKEVLSRFRTSCHNLRIETGRHERPYLPPDRRLCELWWCNPRRDPSFV